VYSIVQGVFTYLESYYRTYSAKYPKLILNTLEQLYGTKGWSARFYKFKDLIATSFESCGSVATYVDALKLHFKRLTELDGKLPDWVLIALILFGLNSKSVNTAP
jgi:hypothetical protein